jgi:hypothetical protein
MPFICQIVDSNMYVVIPPVWEQFRMDVPDAFLCVEFFVRVENQEVSPLLGANL